MEFTWEDVVLAHTHILGMPTEVCVATQTRPEQVKAAILTGEMHAHNTFEEPEMVKEAVFEDVTVTERGVCLTIPPCSVISLEIR